MVAAIAPVIPAERAATGSSAAEAAAVKAASTESTTTAMEATAAPSAVATTATLGKGWDRQTNQGNRSDCYEESVRQGGFLHHGFPSTYKGSLKAGKADRLYRSYS